MKFNIPVNKQTDAYSMSIELDGQVYDLTFHYNAREDRWYLRVSRNNTIVVDGVKLVHGTDLLSQYRAYDVPAGILSIVDSSGLFNDPSSSEFGNTIQLQYDEAV